MPEGSELAELLASVSERVPLPMERMDMELMHAECAALSAALTRFRSANAFLRALEETKTESGGLDAEEEREALSRAAAAAGDSRAAVGSIFRGLRQMDASGVLEALMLRHRELVAEAGTVRLSDLWAAIADRPGVEAALEERGFAPEDLARVKEGIEAHDRLYRILDGALVAEPPNGGSPVPIMVERRRGPMTAERLWRRDMLSAAIAALEEPGPLALELFRGADFGGEPGVPSPRTEPLDPVEMLLAHCSLAAQETEAFAEAVCWGGLPVIRGRDPWFWIALGIAAGVLTLVGVVISIICWANDDFESEHPALCDASTWMSIIGLLLLINTSCAGDDNCKIHLTIRTTGQKLLGYDGAVGPLA